MSYLMRQVSRLICALTVVGALPASAGSMGLVSPWNPAPGACQNPSNSIFYHPQGPLLWGARHTWDGSDVEDENASVLVSVDIGEGADALRDDTGALVGSRLIGSVLQGRDLAGNPVDVVICSVEASGDGSGVFWHRVDAWNPVTQAWENPCLATELVPNPRAMMLFGTWDGSGARHDDDRKATFACETGALAKCATWGYKPWAYDVYGISMADVHQACTRMVRADYCGNGRSHTTLGTVIDHYDSVGVATSQWPGSAGERPPFEAAWLPNGAACFAATRDGRPISAVLDECPERFTPVLLDMGSGDVCFQYWWHPETSVLRNRLVK